jgi:hypothetical protein
MSRRREWAQTIPPAASTRNLRVRNIGIEAKDRKNLPVLRWAIGGGGRSRTYDAADMSRVLSLEDTEIN